MWRQIHEVREATQIKQLNKVVIITESTSGLQKEAVHASVFFAKAQRRGVLIFSMLKIILTPLIEQSLQTIK